MRGPSLKRPLIVYPLIVHLVTLLVSVLILIGGALRIDSGGPYADEKITPVIAAAIDRDPAGGLVIRQTEALSALQTEAPQLWFLVEDDAGNSVDFGAVPPVFEAFRGRLAGLSFAQLRDRTPPHPMTAILRRETADIGALTILGHGPLLELNLIVLLASTVVFLPIILLLSLTSFAITPWIVRRALTGIARIALEAERIDPDRRGRRLSEAHVPREIAPLVRAMNDALRRLDEGHERQQRFISMASHELRTPIAVLQAKVENAGDPAVRALGDDIQRLTILTEQLLDLTRMAQGGTPAPVDLAALARGVVADLAPLAIAGGRTMEVKVGSRETCLGDAAALERVLMNLLRNALDHGGRHVVLRVMGRVLEVEDDGPGIPADQRERVFEPFYRLRPQGGGSGLGLNLVAEVVARHDGRVTIRAAPGRGTIVRVELGLGNVTETHALK
ncbi:HAMP domain-containing sensor histidine kinase [Paracoccus nototheniae]|uniref:histidine kinase n=1 Tax=Paracoccus nototheniae TaxID=2489002 RepID=A0ABW4DT60_9RHOB|nr:HAMP domain-containing sensor histidine kinase [Paracoccus nototheniae]